MSTFLKKFLAVDLYLGRDGLPGPSGATGSPGRDGRDAVAETDCSSSAKIASNYQTTSNHSETRALGSGAVYNRWGRTTCSNHSQLLYKGTFYSKLYN